MDTNQAGTAVFAGDNSGDFAVYDPRSSEPVVAPFNVLPRKYNTIHVRQLDANAFLTLSRPLLRLSPREAASGQGNHAALHWQFLCRITLMRQCAWLHAAHSLLCICLNAWFLSQDVE